MQKTHLTYNDPAAQPAIRLMLAAFPGYNGRKFHIETAETVNASSS